MSNKAQKHTNQTTEHMLNVNQSLIHVICASSVFIMQHTCFAPCVCVYLYVCVGVCVGSILN